MIKKSKVKTKSKTSKAKRVGLLILIAVLALFLGIGGFLLMKFQSKPGTYVHKNSQGAYVLLSDGKPIVVRGVCYNPIPVGENHLYNWWGDAAKPWMIDGKLMQEAGINAVRFYEPGGKPRQVKGVISDLYDNYGIYSIMGHGLSFWDYPHANYADPDFQMNVKRKVYQMVKEYKDEPGILAWVLGNEANYSFDGSVNPWTTPELDAITNARDRKLAKAKIYYSFLNELAQIIKKVDPSRPVGFGNGELGSIDVAKEYCPDFDFVGIIIYRGKSFGNLFRQLKERFGKPCMIIEFGCDSYNAKLQQPDEKNQAFFLKTLWCEVEYNTYEGKGEGNCLGGLIFEWNDEWWKHQQDKSSEWSLHNTEAGWANGSYYFDSEGNLNMNEEWFGIVSLEPEKEDGINKRNPKKAYYTLKEVWEQEDKTPICDWR